MYPTQIGGNQRCRVHLTVRPRRSTHDDAWNTSNPGGGGEHIHHRREGTLATRHIQPHTAYRRDLLSRHHPWCHLREPLLVRHLSLVKGAHIANRVLDRFTHWHV